MTGPSFNHVILTGVQTIAFESLVLLDNQVSSITFQTLGQRAVPSGLGLQVGLSEKVVTKCILGGNSTCTTSGTRGDKESDVWNTDCTDSKSGRTDQNQIHQESAFLIDVILLSSSHFGGHKGMGGHVGGGKGSGRAGHDKGCD